MTSEAAPPVRRASFGPLEIAYDARVLEPRPWTEVQSRWAAELAVDVADGPILELCAGAGHIGLLAALLSDRPLVQVEADDVASAYAVANAAAAGLSDRVEVRTARLEIGIANDERFPVIIADPPYLPTAQVTRWPDDPRTAIDGGSDGLDVMRACIAAIDAHLGDGGSAVVQVAGPAQADRVEAMMAAAVPRLVSLGRRVVDDERAVVAFAHCPPGHAG